MENTFKPSKLGVIEYAICSLIGFWVVFGVAKFLEFQIKPFWYVCLSIACVLIVFFRMIYLDLMSFTLEETMITKKEGIFDLSESRISFNRITNLTIERNLLNRILGLSSISIQTAGSDVVEMDLPFISSELAIKIAKVLQGGANRVDVV